jgi:hypothetical protein
MDQPIHHYVRAYDDYLTGCGKRRSTGYAQDSVTKAVGAVTCQECVASRSFKTECARQDAAKKPGPEDVTHFAADGYKCTCGFDALSATHFMHKPGYDYSRELRGHFDRIKAPAERRMKDELQKQFNVIKARTDERGFTGIQFVVDHVRLSVEAFEALAAAAVRNIEDEYAINYERH